MAMLIGLVTGRFVLLPWLSAGVPGPFDEVAATVFSQQVRFVGAGAMAVAATWSLLRIAGPIARGLTGIAATARARKAGEAVPLTERDLPGGVVLGASAALMVPVLWLCWNFVQGGPLAGSIVPVLTLAFAFIVVLGIFNTIIGEELLFRGAMLPVVTAPASFSPCTHTRPGSARTIRSPA